VRRQKPKPKLAVWKFSSCDGCQLSLLDCEDELLAIAGAFEIAYFLEATRAQSKAAYDVSLVEGSIANVHDAERIKKIRAESEILVTIGACATAGGIQALRNFRDYDTLLRAVYAQPEYIDGLATSTAIADHVKVDFGCGSLSPRHDRGCYGCFGPQERANTASLTRHIAELGLGERELAELYRSFNANAEAFRKEGDAHERKWSSQSDDPRQRARLRRGRGRDARPHQGREGRGSVVPHLRAAAVF
jgi:sulfhydrogenase subunit delta